MPKSCRARFCTRVPNRHSIAGRALLGVVVAWLVCAAGPAQEPPGPHLATAQQQVAIGAIRSAIQHEMQDKDLPALSIAVVVGDEMIWAEGFGFQDAQRQIPASAETVYRVGSVSKLFTAIAVMQLVEQQQLDLDAAIEEYLPEFSPQNPHGTPVTLRQLMTHRSGLVREPPVGSYFDPHEPGMRETVASLNQTALVYPPATRTKYSNAAVTVVGAVVERQTGRRFAEHTQDAIFKPLRMNHTGFEPSPPIRQRLADGWMWTYDGRRFAAPTFLLGTAAAGNLYSNVVDLADFLVALLNDGQAGDAAILRPETLHAMLRPQQDADGRPLDYGLGFRVDRLDGHRRVGHGGAIYGFSTQLAALPDQKLGVVAVASLDVSNGVVGRITDYALRVMLAQQQGAALPTYPTTIAIPVERRAALVGSYRDEEKSVEITALGDQVRWRQGTYIHRLRAASDDGRLISDDVFGFGTVVVEDTPLLRRKDQPPDEPPPRWKGLIGEYGWDHNTLYVLEDHGQLVALIEWFFHYPLTPINENEYAFPDYGLYHGEKLKFDRDETGMATQVVAAEVTFPRRDALAEGGTFRITPVKPIEELRRQALQARPPKEGGEFRESDLVEITAHDPTIKLDIRYATTNNFMGAVFYKQPRAFMQRPAAEALVRAHRRLEQRGLGLLIHDAYRPWHVTKMFWDATPEQFKDFVANPANGSRHNRGCAVDLTLYDRATGQPIQMVAEYDEFSPRSFPLYPGGTSRQRWYRDLLRRTMEAEGFSVYEYEWWHFDYQDWQQYQLGKVTFEEILAQAADPDPAQVVRVSTLELKLNGQSINAAGGMTRDAAGNLYLSDFGKAFGQPDLKTKVYRYNPTNGQVSLFAEGFRGASGCCFDSQGNFYQSNPFGNQISRRTADGQITYDWVTEGISTPIGIVADDQDHLYVCNCGSNTIRKIDPDGNSTEFANSELLKCPNGLTIDENNNLYACNFSDGAVVKIDPQGEVTLVVRLPELQGGPSPVGNGHLTYHKDHLYVATIGTGQVYRVSLAGEAELVAGRKFGFSNQDGEAAEATFSKPNGIVVGPDGRRLYVLCSDPTWPAEPQQLHPTRLRVITGFEELIP